MCHCQGFSNNSVPHFSDVECLTVYLFAIMEEEKFKIKSIHQYAHQYLRSWFPQLPSYQAFNHRINRLSAVFAPLINHLLQDMDKEGVKPDSMPISTCSAKRAGKVAPELTSKGYCSTKKTSLYWCEVA